MAAELPPYVVGHSVREGRGHVVWTFHPEVLTALIEAAGVNEVEELPDANLYRLCFKASSDVQHARNQTSPDGGVKVSAIILDHEDSPRVIHSTDEGAAFLLRRFISETGGRIDLLCNPLYNTVDVELRVFDISPEASLDPQENISRCVLARTLIPLPPDIPA
jgi:hypothetical protein